MPNTTHILRPIFTQRLFEKLKTGDSINLVGLRGAGCDRALEDLEKMAAAENIPALRLDMNEYKISPDAFSRAVWEKTHPNMPNPSLIPLPEATAAALPASANVPMQISEILARKNGAPSHVFLLLDNFHKLLDNPHQKFPRKFFDDLNSLKNRPHVSLCLVTEKPHLSYKIHIPDESGKGNTSWLHLHYLEIAGLTRDEIRTELNRQLGTLPNWQQESQPEIILDGIHSHLHPLELLDLLKTSYEFEDGEISATIRLRRALDTFGAKINRRPNASAFSWESIIGKLKELSEIWKNLKPGK